MHPYDVKGRKYIGTPLKYYFEDVGISRELLSDRQLVKLDCLKNLTLCCTAESVRKERKAGYQENLLKDLLNDILSSL